MHGSFYRTARNWQLRILNSQSCGQENMALVLHESEVSIRVYRDGANVGHNQGRRSFNEGTNHCDCAGADYQCPSYAIVSCSYRQRVSLYPNRMYSVRQVCVVGGGGGGVVPTPPNRFKKDCGGCGPPSSILVGFFYIDGVVFIFSGIMRHPCRVACWTYVIVPP